MAGFLIYTTTGVFFLAISFLESLSMILPLPRSLPFIFSSSLSILAILNSIITSLLAAAADDPIGCPLPLSSLPVAALFLILSLSSLLLALPPPLLDLLSLFSFTQQFLLFRLRNNKDPDGLENRYFDLLLVPISICLASSLVAVANPRSSFPRAARAVGIALQGSWFLQMAFSLFTSLVAHGCQIQVRGGADFSVVCGGHADVHRARAIAGLQFNCHLAFVVVLGVGVYGVLVGRKSRGGVGEYGLIGKELRRLERVSASDFRLDSDEDEERDAGEEGDLVSVHVNGFGGGH